MLKVYGSLDAIWRELDARAQGVLGEMVYQALVERRDIRVVDQITDAVEKYGIHVVRKGDSCYPPLLAHVNQAPEILYVRGRRDLSDAQTFAMVGSRRCTRYGRTQAERIAYELTTMGVTVVSGMARGIDTAAHAGALRANGRTIAVLGCGLDIAYPPENATLMEHIIAQGGSVISEYAPGTPPRSTNFPQRNRIISGMCAGTLLVEAEKGSGAMITVNLALEQGRDVFAIPGNIDNPNCAGSNRLLREGARFDTSGADILEEYSGLYPVKTAAARHTEPYEAPQTNIDKVETISYIDVESRLEGCSEDQKTLLRLLAGGEKHMDELIAASGQSAAKVAAELTLLGIRGLVRALPGRRYSIK